MEGYNEATASYTEITLIKLCDSNTKLHCTITIIHNCSNTKKHNNVDIINANP